MNDCENEQRDGRRSRQAVKQPDDQGPGKVVDTDTAEPSIEPCLRRLVVTVPVRVRSVAVRVAVAVAVAVAVTVVVGVTVRVGVLTGGVGVFVPQAPRVQMNIAPVATPVGGLVPVGSQPTSV